MGVTLRFTRRRPAAHAHDCGHDHGLTDALRQVEALARARFRLEAAVPVRVQELATTDPGFPPRETRILFWTGNDNQHQYRVFKPAVEVTAGDLPPWWYKDALILDEHGCCCCG